MNPASVIQVLERMVMHKKARDVVTVIIGEKKAELML